MKYIAILLGVLFFVLLGAYLIAERAQAPVIEEGALVPSSESPEEEEDSVPTEEGLSWVEDQLQTHPYVVVSSPQPGERITSPLTIEGEARGMWFFEASFPISVVNWDGLIIGEGYAQAQGEWMTEEFVPFTAEITFTTPSFGERGAIILQKDNPSGLPENDAAVEIPIRFKQ